MLDDINEVRAITGNQSLNMRIGLHFGNCLGGIVGSGRLRYDVWGLDVLIGNLIESNGIPGCVVVSEALKQFLDASFPKYVWVLV